MGLKFFIFAVEPPRLELAFRIRDRLVYVGSDLCIPGDLADSCKPAPPKREDGLTWRVHLPAASKGLAW